MPSIPGLIAGIAASTMIGQASKTAYNEYLKAGLPIKSATDTSGMTYEAMLYCKTNIGGYFFDGFIQVEYTHELEVTSNPVETGTAIADHAYRKPAQIEMVIRMSNVHQSLVRGQFKEGYNRSVAAWNVLRKIQEDRIPVSVLTQLGLYQNMILKTLKATEDEKTYMGLYATATLVELPVARVKTVKISSASQTTIQTQMGQINAVPTTSQEDNSILYSWGVGAGANASIGGGFSSSVSDSSGGGLGIKVTCYCYNCNDDGSGHFGTTATASGNKATVGRTAAMNRDTMKKYGLKLGDTILISGIGTRVLEDYAGVKDIVDIYVPATGSVRHCYCARNEYSGKRTTFAKVG